ncbi:MAG: ATP-binding protein [Planctomycetota bacterium]
MTVAAVAIILHQVSSVQRSLVRVIALRDAALFAVTLEEFNDLYTSEVVARIGDGTTRVTHDYESMEGAIPIPMDLITGFARDVGEDAPGVAFALYSPYPFPEHRETGGLRDQFARDAWESFGTDPERPLHRYEDLEERPYLRYAVAAVMRQGCVDCHNTHDESPKRDWRVGEVRGILEVDIPLDSVAAGTSTSIWKTLGLLAGLAFFGMSASALAISRLRHAAAESRRLAAESRRTSSRLRDEVTERSLAESNLEQSVEQLERSNRELAEYCSVVSHDLREPLRAVRCYCQLLARRAPGDPDEERERYLQFAIDGAERMQHLVDDLLAYSRVGRREGAFESADLGESVSAAIANLEVAIRESGARIEVGPMPRVVGDRTELIQLLQNLLENAIKFRREEHPHVRVCSTVEEGICELTVEDNGIGIDPRHAERIFGVFKRLHRREEYPGTGIGLAICKKIVERHGGRIWFDSAAGGGTVFHVILPCGDAWTGGAAGAVTAPTQRPEAISPLSSGTAPLEDRRSEASTPRG